MPAEFVPDQQLPPEQPPPPQQQEQQQHYQPHQQQHQDDPAVYYPSGSVLDVTTNQGWRIPRAEVLFHDPVMDAILVRFPAASGRPNLHDIAFLRLCSVQRVQLVSLRAGESADPHLASGLAGGDIDLEKVRRRLDRNMQQMMQRQQQHQHPSVS